MIAALLVAVALASPPPATEARALAQRSIVEYDAGDFEKALADAQKAFELEPMPGLLYNLGQCHRALHHWERAEFFYRGYLRRDPRAKNRDAVSALIAEMQARQKEAAAAQPPGPAPILVEAPAAPAPPPAKAAAAGPVPASTPAPEAAVTAAPRHGGPPAGAWIVGGAGAAAMIAGGVLAILATSARAGDTAPPASGPWLHAIPQGQFDAANGEAVGANGAFYGGAALLVGGIVWAITGWHSAAASSPAAGAAGF